MPPAVLSKVVFLSLFLCARCLSPDTREYLWHVQKARLAIGLAPLHAPPAALSTSAAAMAARMSRSGSSKARGTMERAATCGASGILYTAGTKSSKWRHAGAVCAHLWRSFGMWDEIYSAGDFAAVAVKRAKDGRVWCVHLALNGVRYRGRKCKRDPNWFELRQRSIEKLDHSSAMAVPSATPRPSQSPTPTPSTSPTASRKASADKKHVFRNKRVVMKLGGGRLLDLTVNCKGGPCRYCDVKNRKNCFTAAYSITLDKSMTPTLPSLP